MQKLLSPFFVAILILFEACETPGINRKELVERHIVTVNHPDSLSSLTIGNGNFAFTCDITGLQSFPEFYNNGILLGTESNWGWHSFPNIENFALSQVHKTSMVNNRDVTYVHDYRSEGDSERAKASEWLRANPHRINLGTLGFRFFDSHGKVLNIDALENINQQLNPYSGKIQSYFEIEGIPVNVETVCHFSHDVIAVKVNSPLLELNRLQIVYQFNQPNNEWKNKIEPTFNSEEILVLDANDNVIELERSLDDFTQYTKLYTPEGKCVINNEGECVITTKNDKSEIQVSVSFANQSIKMPVPSFSKVMESSKKGWAEYWENGGAVDFSKCTDDRAIELERRVILSQYLTRVQCAGNLPPQETGLTMNSWYGKFHMEMIWWHVVHFTLWNHPEILEKQIDFYFTILEQARNTSIKQGYEGVRWPKMTDPSGAESPSNIGPYLIWQQPHVIYMCELIAKQSHNKKSVFKKYKPLIVETANFMTSYADFNSKTGFYNLGPSLIPAQERFNADSTINPTFELTYWYWGLTAAINWLKQMHEPVPDDWEKVLKGLAPLAVKNESYLFTQTATDSYSNPKYLTDHPMVLGIWGMLPKTELVDSSIFENTYQRIKTEWFWDNTWGWDFPLVAMAAAELGHSEDAIDFLLKNEKTNTYLKNGHNYQDERLPLYLPGNGALLTAIAQMCVKNQFPKNGNWEVKWENLSSK